MMFRIEIPAGATIEFLTQIAPGSKVRVTDGQKNPRNSHRGLSFADLNPDDPDWALHSLEEVESTDAPVWVQGNAIGARHLSNREPVAYTHGRKPKWPNPGAGTSMEHWVLMAIPMEKPDPLDRFVMRPGDVRLIPPSTSGAPRTG